MTISHTGDDGACGCTMPIAHVAGVGISPLAIVLTLVAVVGTTCYLNDKLPTWHLQRREAQRLRAERVAEEYMEAARRMRAYRSDIPLN